MIDPRIAEGVKLVPELGYIEECAKADSENVAHITLAQIQTIIAALTAAGEMAGERQGMVAVPVEPTDEMIAAGISERHLQGVPEAWKLATVNIYKAMIAAAPASPVGEDVVTPPRWIGTNQPETVEEEQAKWRDV